MHIIHTDTSTLNSQADLMPIVAHGAHFWCQETHRITGKGLRVSWALELLSPIRNVLQERPPQTLYMICELSEL